MKTDEKTYLVIGQDETDGPITVKKLTQTRIKELGLDHSPDHVIVDGIVIKDPSKHWPLQ